jgi:hypothetical protein
VKLFTPEQEFELRLKQGACFRDNSWKFEKITKPKYFIVLSRDCSTNEIQVVLTTSQQGYYKDNTALEADIVRFAAVSFFPKETIINCRQVLGLDRTKMKARFVLKQIEFIGQLPNTEANETIETVRNSRQIAKQIKKLICEDL